MALPRRPWGVPLPYKFSNTQLSASDTGPSSAGASVTGTDTSQWMANTRAARGAISCGGANSSMRSYCSASLAERPLTSSLKVVAISEALAVQPDQRNLLHLLHAPQRSLATQVNGANDRLGPLLLLAGGRDHTGPPVWVRSVLKRYDQASAVTEFKEFAGQGHSPVIDSGWQILAEYSLAWLKSNQL